MLACGESKVAFLLSDGRVCALRFRAATSIRPAPGRDLAEHESPAHRLREDSRASMNDVAVRSPAAGAGVTTSQPQAAVRPRGSTAARRGVARARGDRGLAAPLGRIAEAAHEKPTPTRAYARRHHQRQRCRRARLSESPRKRSLMQSETVPGETAPITNHQQSRPLCVRHVSLLPSAGTGRLGRPNAVAGLPLLQQPSALGRVAAPGAKRHSGITVIGVIQQRVVARRRHRLVRSLLPT